HRIRLAGWAPGECEHLLADVGSKDVPTGRHRRGRSWCHRARPRREVEDALARSQPRPGDEAVDDRGKALVDLLPIGGLGDPIPDVRLPGQALLSVAHWCTLHSS